MVTFGELMVKFSHETAGSNPLAKFTNGRYR